MPFHITQPLSVAAGARGAAHVATGTHYPTTGPWSCHSLMEIGSTQGLWSSTQIS